MIQTIVSDKIHHYFEKKTNNMRTPKVHTGQSHTYCMKMYGKINQNTNINLDFFLQELGHALGLLFPRQIFSTMYQEGSVTDELINKN